MKSVRIATVIAVVPVLVAVTMDLSAGPKGPTIVGVVKKINSSGPFAGAFDTLIAALGAADPAVLDTLSGNGQYTVFAPTDDAFKDLGFDSGNVGDVPQGVLTEILLYHVAYRRRYAASVLDSDRFPTLQRGFLLQDGGVLTDSQDRKAKIIVTDVEAANGIIHAIDAVVLPFAF